MRKAITLLLTFVTLLLAAQDKPANYLHYVMEDITYNRKKEKTVTKSEYTFILNGQQLIMDRVIPRGNTYPRQIIDHDKRIIVLVRDNGSDYVIEDLDSIKYDTDLKFDPTGETKTINGFQCEKYTMTVDYEVYKERWGIKGASLNLTYVYTAWITKDISIDRSFSDYITGALSRLYTNISNEGVIVKLETTLIHPPTKREYYTETTLDASKLQAEPQKIVWPWQVTNPGFALVQITTSVGEVGFYYRAKDGTPEKQSKRMKELAIRITGDEKVRTKKDYVTDVFW